MDRRRETCPEVLSEGLGDSSVKPGHGEKMEISDGDPRAGVLPASNGAMIYVKGQFEVGECVFERADGLSIFGTNPQLILDTVQQRCLRIAPVINSPIREFPQAS